MSGYFSSSKMFLALAASLAVVVTLTYAADPSRCHYYCVYRHSAYCCDDGSLPSKYSSQPLVHNHQPVVHSLHKRSTNLSKKRVRPVSRSRRKTFEEKHLKKSEQSFLQWLFPSKEEKTMKIDRIGPQARQNMFNHMHHRIQNRNDIAGQSNLALKPQAITRDSLLDVGNEAPHLVKMADIDQTNEFIPNIISRFNQNTPKIRSPHPFYPNQHHITRHPFVSGYKLRQNNLMSKPSIQVSPLTTPSLGNPGVRNTNNAGNINRHPFVPAHQLRQNNLKPSIQVSPLTAPSLGNPSAHRTKNAGHIIRHPFVPGPPKLRQNNLESKPSIQVSPLTTSSSGNTDVHNRKNSDSVKAGEILAMELISHSLKNQKELNRDKRHDKHAHPYYQSGADWHHNPFTDPFGGMHNPFHGMNNPFHDMHKTYKKMHKSYKGFSKNFYKMFKEVSGYDGPQHMLTDWGKSIWKKYLKSGHHNDLKSGHGHGHGIPNYNSHHDDIQNELGFKFNDHNQLHIDYDDIFAKYLRTDIGDPSVLGTIVDHYDKTGQSNTKQVHTNVINVVHDKRHSSNHNSHSSYDKPINYKSDKSHHPIDKIDTVMLDSPSQGKIINIVTDWRHSSERNPYKPSSKTVRHTTSKKSAKVPILERNGLKSSSMIENIVNQFINPAEISHDENPNEFHEYNRTFFENYPNSISRNEISDSDLQSRTKIQNFPKRTFIELSTKRSSFAVYEKGRLTKSNNIKENSIESIPKLDSIHDLSKITSNNNDELTPPKHNKRSSNNNADFDSVFEKGTLSKSNNIEENYIESIPKLDTINDLSKITTNHNDEDTENASLDDETRQKISDLVLNIPSICPCLDEEDPVDTKFGYSDCHCPPLKELALIYEQYKLEYTTEIDQEQFIRLYQDKLLPWYNKYSNLQLIF